MARKNVVHIYSDNCHLCGHLDPDKKTKFKSCHYIKGNNPYCPASEVKIVVIGKAYRYAAQVIDAREKHDVTAEAKILGLVAKWSKEFQAKFYHILENPDA